MEVRILDEQGKGKDVKNIRACIVLGVDMGWTPFVVMSHSDPMVLSSVLTACEGAIEAAAETLGMKREDFRLMRSMMKEHAADTFKDFKKL